MLHILWVCLCSIYINIMQIIFDVTAHAHICLNFQSWPCKFAVCHLQHYLLGRICISILMFMSYHVYNNFFTTFFFYLLANYTIVFTNLLYMNTDAPRYYLDAMSLFWCSCWYLLVSFVNIFRIVRFLSFIALLQ